MHRNLCPTNSSSRRSIPKSTKQPHWTILMITPKCYTNRCKIRSKALHLFFNWLAILIIYRRLFKKVRWTSSWSIARDLSRCRKCPERLNACLQRRMATEHWIGHEYRLHIFLFFIVYGLPSTCVTIPDRCTNDDGRRSSPTICSLRWFLSDYRSWNEEIRSMDGGNRPWAEEKATWRAYESDYWQ